MSDGVKFIISKRSGGYFCSTQGTILSLKALTTYTRWSKKTAEAGDVDILVDGKVVATRHFEAGERGEMKFSGLEKYLGAGNYQVGIRFRGTKNALPYSFNAHWNTDIPASSPKAKVNLKTHMSSTTVAQGQTVRLSATLTNITNQGLPMTMAVIGIPGGCTPQPWQLKELTDKKQIDFYEIRGSTLAIYYRQMTPNERKTIHLDLKADIPGTWQAPASRAYLYYTAEDKNWGAIHTVTVTK